MLLYKGFFNNGTAILLHNNKLFKIAACWFVQKNVRQKIFVAQFLQQNWNLVIVRQFRELFLYLGTKSVALLGYAKYMQDDR